MMYPTENIVVAPPQYVQVLPQIMAVNTGYKVEDIALATMNELVAGATPNFPARTYMFNACFSDWGMYWNIACQLTHDVLEIMLVRGVMDNNPLGTAARNMTSLFLSELMSRDPYLINVVRANPQLYQQVEAAKEWLRANRGYSTRYRNIPVQQQQPQYPQQYGQYPQQQRYPQQQYAGVAPVGNRQATQPGSYFTGTASAPSVNTGSGLYDNNAPVQTQPIIEDPVIENTGSDSGVLIVDRDIHCVQAFGTNVNVDREQTYTFIAKEIRAKDDPFAMANRTIAEGADGEIVAQDIDVSKYNVLTGRAVIVSSLAEGISQKAHALLEHSQTVSFIKVIVATPYAFPKIKYRLQELVDRLAEASKDASKLMSFLKEIATLAAQEDDATRDVVLSMCDIYAAKAIETINRGLSCNLPLNGHIDSLDDIPDVLTHIKSLSPVYTTAYTRWQSEVFAKMLLTGDSDTIDEYVFESLGVDTKDFGDVAVLPEMHHVALLKYTSLELGIVSSDKPLLITAANQSLLDLANKLLDNDIGGRCIIVTSDYVGYEVHRAYMGAKDAVMLTGFRIA